ncbi:MAG: Tex family protein, partial [Clostridiales bacterium]|nr:Tex family protein [Clostridiales bacterium]
MMDIIGRLSEEFKLLRGQVENTVKLMDEGCTVPFIARYRKEVTGEMNDQVLRELHERLLYLRSLEERRQEVHKLIEEQGKMTPGLAVSIANAKALQELEDIYAPFRPKRRTRASIAREKGLGPLAEIIMAQEEMPSAASIFAARAIAFSGVAGDAGITGFTSDSSSSGIGGSTAADDYIYHLAAPFVNIQGMDSPAASAEEAINGALDIIAEDISDMAKVRQIVRRLLFRDGTIVTKALKEEDSVYRMYNDYREPVNRIAKHRILAINRGEKEDFLSVTIEMEDDIIISQLADILLKNPPSPTTPLVNKALLDSWSRLIKPSALRELRTTLTEGAEEQAMKVFSANLKQLLLAPPLKDKVVLALDPAYRTGCKIAVIDPTGKLLETTVVYPTMPQNKVEEARQKLASLILRHTVEIIAIGNGTASKESEIFIAALLKDLAVENQYGIKPRKIFYMVVSEAGASVYSASKLGAEEFPDFDVSLRSAASIGRRLQDPLAELVKIDPKAIGVGQYQHDMNQKKLGEALGGVVEDCVNSVGADVNTASPALLSYISGINSAVAKNIVAYREEKGQFRSRMELKKVKKLGDKAFEQCAGFLRVSGGSEMLDNTAVHPESYAAAKKLLEITGYTGLYTEKDVTKELVKDISKNSSKNLAKEALNDHSKSTAKYIATGKLVDLKKNVESIGMDKVAQIAGVGVPTLQDIIRELQKPGRDPRDELPKPLFQSDMMDMKDLKPGMLLEGTVRNIADFGAFVDIGVHQDGLVHISALSNTFVKDPHTVVKAGQVVKVKVLEVDEKRKRIALTMRLSDEAPAPG